MHSTTRTRPTRRSTSRKVLASLAIAGTAAAVAGLGTFGTFTDSTTPVATTVEGGTVDIELSPVGATVPLTTGDLVPGDSITRAVDLTNAGTSALSSVTFTAAPTGAPSILTTDTVHGLQLGLTACSVPWTGTGAALSCPGSSRSLYAGPAAAGNVPLADPVSLLPGGVDHLVLSLSLPTSAGNAFQGTSASLGITFTAAQRAGAAR